MLHRSSTHLAFVLVALAFVACKKDEKPPPVPTQAPPEAPKPVVKTVGTAPGGNASLASLAGSYQLDPSHSTVTFRIKHMDISYTIGRFNKVAGSLVIDADPGMSRVAIEVDPASIFTADKKRDDHLKGPDFLNVAQYPTISFTSTSIKPAGDGYEVAGDLELHGVKRRVAATLELVGGGASMMDQSKFLVGFTGELDVKRSDFGMTNMIGMVGDDVRLTIAVEAARL